jgi:uncharacterized membrane protein
MVLTQEIIQIFNFLGSLVCHQIYERTLRVGGYYLPVCSRDTGAYVGLLCGYGLIITSRRKNGRGLPNLYVTLLMMLPLLIDSFSQLLGFWTSTNDIRLLTGLLFGTATTPILVYVLSLPPLNGKIPLLSKIQPSTPILDGNDAWLSGRSLLLGATLSGILFVAIRLIVGAESILFYWMLSIPIISVIIWHIIIFPLLLLIAGLKKKPSAR